ncbi:MAG: hypothetical protein WC718_10980 [Phycisphaerales bacterium]|jgi:hypothetical protein
MKTESPRSPARAIPLWIRLSIIAWALAAAALLLMVKEKVTAMGGEAAFRHFGSTLRNAGVVLAAVGAGLAVAAIWRQRWDVALKLLAGVVLFGGSLAALYF